MKEIYKEYNENQRDPESQAFYTSAEWRAVRAQKLREQPLCEECLRHGYVRAAKLVDHVTPIRDGGARLDFNNLQSLCWSCHSRKSILEGSSFGKKDYSR